MVGKGGGEGGNEGGEGGGAGEGAREEDAVELGRAAVGGEGVGGSVEESVLVLWWVEAGKVGEEGVPGEKEGRGGGSVASGLDESLGQVMKLRSPQIKVRGGEGKEAWMEERIEEIRGKFLSEGR